MIYLKNNTETQAIYIPRQTVLGSDYIATTEKYEKGYNDGFKDGKERQKEKLSNLYVAENGQYEREDGWNVVTVDVPDLNGDYNEGYQQGHTEGYNEGKTDGVNEQKGKLSQIRITENGTYAKEDGYSEVVVDVPDLNGSYDEGYTQGKIDGANEQKSKLETINITENGTYRKEDGYNEVVVNVPDLNGSYNEGYEQGQADVAANARDIEVTKNGQYGDGKTLYKTINVNVIPKINIQEAGVNFSYSTFTEVPEWADFNGITDMNNMFCECSNLQTIPLIDTSKVTNMNYMFQSCGKLQTIPQIDTSNVKEMRWMFYECRILQTIPQLNTSKVTTMANMFQYCYALQTIPQIDTSNVSGMDRMFYGCTNLRTLPELDASNLAIISNYFGYSTMSYLTDIGGWKNLKMDWKDGCGLDRCPNLTYQSCINVLNGLYDFVGNGSTQTRTLKVHQNFLDKVGEEINIGTNKGWTITA